MTWAEMLTGAISLIIFAVVTYLIVPLIKRGGEWLQSKTNNENTKTAIHNLEVVAENIVYSLQQNVVEQMKKDSADGKLDSLQIAELKVKAVNQIKDNLAPATMKVLESMTTDIGEYILSVVDKNVIFLKK